jgi:hypothetical protein
MERKLYIIVSQLEDNNIMGLENKFIKIEISKEEQKEIARQEVEKSKPEMDRILEQRKYAEIKSKDDFVGRDY